MTRTCYLNESLRVQRKLLVPLSSVVLDLERQSMDRVWCIVLLFAQIASLTNGLPAWPTPAPKTTTSTTEPPPSPEQIAMNNYCYQNCKTSLCYLEDKDCRKFIMCEWYAPTQQYYAYAKRCAFGTFWTGEKNKEGCVHPSKATCKLGRCSKSNIGHKFNHIDGNCKTYWECTADPDTGSIMPKPSCCRSGFRFDGAECVDNRGQHACRDTCPLPIEADKCIPGGDLTSPSNDNNCVTYWNCGGQHPSPACCPKGQGYDVKHKTCTRNVRCGDTCPEVYQKDRCLTQGVDRYKIPDDSCRTFLQCKSKVFETRACCPSNEKFNQQTQLCEGQNVADNCTNICPGGYKTVQIACPLKRSRKGSKFYLQAGEDNECAPGTFFSEETCGCGLLDVNAPDNSCNMELDLLFNGTVLERRGSMNHVKIMTRGQILPGKAIKNSVPFFFNGSLRLSAPYSKQSFKQIYASVIVKPEPEVRTRQVLLSNCMGKDLKQPTFDLVLENGNVVVTIKTDKVESTMLSIPYWVYAWQVITVMYDGYWFQMAIEAQDQLPKHVETMLMGSVPIAAEGLNVGKCRVNPVASRENDGFIGSIAKLQFSKCLRPEWLDSYYKAMKMEPKTMPTPPPTATP